LAATAVSCAACARNQYPLDDPKTKGTVMKYGGPNAEGIPLGFPAARCSVRAHTASPEGPSSRPPPQTMLGIVDSAKTSGSQRAVRPLSDTLFAIFPVRS
jgi:hypothetical protein